MAEKLGSREWGVGGREKDCRPPYDFPRPYTNPSPLSFPPIKEGQGGVRGEGQVYCKWLGKMVELDFCKKECTDRMPIWSPLTASTDMT